VFRDRVHTAHTQDFLQIYARIEKRFGGETPLIVKYLRKSGFSCDTNALIEINCIFAYCGERLFILSFKMEFTICSGVKRRRFAQTSRLQFFATRGVDVSDRLGYAIVDCIEYAEAVTSRDGITN